ncbi:hypothetical protein FJZ31_30290 [Candidatus Poribacteria bacterium]|nr:hypothetical protein [Candidatus Poribacteria bacterium]
MANADILWNVINANWPNETTWLTIGQVIALAPIGTNDISNRSTYDFAILTMLSTVRRNYVIHRNPAAQAAIDGQIVLTNRNNGIWRQWLNAQVRKTANINIGPLPQAGGAGAGIGGEVTNPPTNIGGENFIPNHQNHNNQNVFDDNLKKIIIDIRQAIKSDLLDNHKVEKCKSPFSWDINKFKILFLNLMQRK